MEFKNLVGFTMNDQSLVDFPFRFILRFCVQQTIWVSLFILSLLIDFDCSILVLLKGSFSRFDLLSSCYSHDMLQLEFDYF